MDFSQLRLCRKSPAAGGLSRKELNDLARSMDINPQEYRNKNDLCQVLLERALQIYGLRPLTNTEIARQLGRLVSFYYQENEPYRAAAIAEGLRKFTLLQEPLISLENPIKHLISMNIGMGTIERIAEILVNGRLAELSPETPEKKIPLPKAGRSPKRVSTSPKATTPTRTVSTSPTRVLEGRPRDIVFAELNSLFGFGPAKVNELLNHGVTGIDDLIHKYNIGQIHLTKAQQIGLQYYLHFQERIPREEVEHVGNAIIDIGKALSLNSDFIGKIVGSYRRGAASSGDIDILISSTDNKNYLPEIVQELKDQGFIEHVISFGPVKFAGTYVNSFPNKGGILRHLDIRWVPYSNPASWATSLQHSTGDRSLNIHLRKWALQRGFTLSEHGLFTLENHTRIPILSEKALFNTLGLKYIPPQYRNGNINLTEWELPGKSPRD